MTSEVAVIFCKFEILMCLNQDKFIFRFEIFGSRNTGSSTLAIGPGAQT